MRPSFGTNQAAEKINVYYAGTSTITEGMPLSYEYDTTTSVVGTIASGTKTMTIAEGSQCDGKYKRVVDPLVTLTVTGTITGTFTAGESVVQGTTAATGVVVEANTAATSVRIYVTTGTFTVSAYTITGASSGATLATPTAITVKSNLQWPAGVVAGKTWNGLSGPRWLDIYTPNGAIVPVVTAMATVKGQTILAINSATNTFGNPTTSLPNYGVTAGQTDARAVAIAEETISAAGVTLARFDPTMFMYQGGQVSDELQVAAGTANCSVNRSNVSFANTDGNCQALHYRTLLAGAGGHAEKGVYRFETFISAEVGHPIYGIDNIIDFQSEVTGVGGTYVVPFRSTVRSRGADRDLSGVTVLACYAAEWHLTDTAGTGGLTDSPTWATIFYVNSSAAGTQPDYLLISEVKEAVGGVATVKSGDADGGSIKIRLDSIDYWLHYWTAAS